MIFLARRFVIAAVVVGGIGYPAFQIMVLIYMQILVMCFNLT